MAKDKLSKLNVNRGEMATALDRAFTKFAAATEKEIDARVAAAIALHKKDSFHGIVAAVRSLFARKGK